MKAPDPWYAADRVHPDPRGLIRDLFGCRPIEPGWVRFVLEPRPLDLAKAAVAILTPHGNIEIEQNGESQAVRIPAGTVMLRQNKEMAGPSVWKGTLL